MDVRDRERDQRRPARAPSPPGRFREDLFFRLNVIELHVPPIARPPRRPPASRRAFLATSGQEGVAGPRLGRAASDALLQYDWPGNVRELQNRIQRAMLVCSGGVITPEHLGLGAAPVRVDPTRAGGSACGDRARGGSSGSGGDRRGPSEIGRNRVQGRGRAGHYPTGLLSAHGSGRRRPRTTPQDLSSSEGKTDRQPAVRFASSPLPPRFFPAASRFIRAPSPPSPERSTCLPEPR